ncbi:MAG: glutathione S-transferase family protein [Sphingosinicella sp.]|nr:glutathione S-transferase family protein [Sphingosinicella sp.]
MPIDPDAAITISGFAWVPDFARGQVRDLRVRWILEEVGLFYRTRLLKQGDQDTPEYRALQPFGQVPIFEENGFVLFETGAIVLHIAERSEDLLPADPAARARVVQWVIAALNSIEPFAMNVANIDFFYSDQEWARLRRPGAVELMRRRLAGLSNALRDQAYFEGERFTAADLIMTGVLRVLEHTKLIDGYTNLSDFKARCEGRPAFAKALASQIADFEER